MRAVHDLFPIAPAAETQKIQEFMSERPELLSLSDASITNLNGDHDFALKSLV
jgi:hypothetical protein